MNILIVNGAMSTLFGGGENFDKGVAMYLQKKGHTVTVATLCPIFGKLKYRHPDLSVAYVKSLDLMPFVYFLEKYTIFFSAVIRHLHYMCFEWLTYRKFKKAFSSSTYDIVQCTSLFRLPRYILKQYDRAVISWLPGPPSRWASRMILDLVKYNNFGLFGRGAPIESLKSLSLRPNLDYFLIPPHLALERIQNVDRFDVRNKYDIPRDALVGITVARFVPIKNHKMIIDALKLVQGQRKPAWHWLFIGDGPLLGEMKKYAKAKGIYNYIRFLGYKSKDDIYSILKSCDAFALTSFYENYGTVCLEAWACGLPVIMTKVGYIQTLVEKSKAGINIPINESLLAKTLIDWQSAKKRLSYAKNGAKFTQQFDIEIIGKKIEDIYQKTIRGKHV